MWLIMKLNCRKKEQEKQDGVAGGGSSRHGRKGGGQSAVEHQSKCILSGPVSALSINLLYISYRTSQS